MRIFVGHDSRQPDNTRACVRSIERFGHTVELLDRAELAISCGYNREEDGSTEFTYTRFLVPYICRYNGVALFCDSDFIWLVDPEELMGYFDIKKVVHCVQHDKMPVRSKQKMEGKLNEYYPRKWWSSLMLFNCEHQYAKRLTPDSVNSLNAAALHRLGWASQAIGELPVEYNYLVGYYTDDITPKALHFTDGTPMYETYRNEPYAEKYFEFI